MRYCAFLLLVVLALFAAQPSLAATELKTLVVDGVTITYPADLEAQAQEVARVVKKVTVPRLKELEQMNAALGDADVMAERISALTGLTEQKDKICETYAKCYAVMYQLSLESLKNIKLLKVTDIKDVGTYSDGKITFTYKAHEKRVRYTTRVSSSSETPEAVYLPILITEDGKIDRYGNKSVERLFEASYSTIRRFLIAPIHEATELGVIRTQYQPYTRWFNDGVANWVMLQIVQEYTPTIVRDVKDFVFPELIELNRRKINLLAWPQLLYQEKLTGEDVALDGAHYRFATQLIDRLFRDEAEDALAQVMQRLKGKENPDTETICAAIDEVTGKDSRRMLLEYTPKHVRDGLRKKTPAKLLAQARACAATQDYPGVVTRLAEVLEMTPSDLIARANYAVALRKTGAPREEVERQLDILAHLQPDVELSETLFFTPDDAEALLLLTRTFLKQKNLDKVNEYIPRVMHALNSIAVVNADWHKLHHELNVTITEKNRDFPQQ